MCYTVGGSSGRRTCNRRKGRKDRGCTAVSARQERRAVASVFDANTAVAICRLPENQRRVYGDKRGYEVVRFHRICYRSDLRVNKMVFSRVPQLRTSGTYN